MSIILFIIALILVAAIGSLSFVATFFYYLITLRWKDGIKRFERFSLDLAISLDQLGNVVCKVPFTWSMVKGNYYGFGNPDETVSFVLAVNRNKNTLTKFGIFVCKVLDFMDSNHMEKAIKKQKENDLISKIRHESNEY